MNGKLLYIIVASEASKKKIVYIHVYMYVSLYN